MRFTQSLGLIPGYQHDLGDQILVYGMAVSLLKLCSLLGKYSQVEVCTEGAGGISRINQAGNQV